MNDVIMTGTIFSTISYNKNPVLYTVAIFLRLNKKNVHVSEIYASRMTSAVQLLTGFSKCTDFLEVEQTDLNLDELK